jgi:hypothetical protein
MLIRRPLLCRRRGFGRWFVLIRVMVCAIAAVLGAALVSAAAPQAQPAPPKSAANVKPAEQAVIGTIERFEEVARRLVLATKEGQVAFVLAADVIIRLGSRVVPPAALATHHGRRAKVRFTQANGRRMAHWVVISSEPPRVSN